MDETQLLEQNLTQAFYFFLSCYSNRFDATLFPPVALPAPPLTLSTHPSVSNAVGATNNDLVFQTELLKQRTEEIWNSIEFNNCA